MSLLKQLRTSGYHVITQQQGSLSIKLRARPVNPADIFAANSIISALYSVHAQNGDSSDLDEADRLAANAGDPIERAKQELLSKQKIARAVVESISIDGGETWRPVDWVDTPEEEADRFHVRTDTGEWIDPPEGILRESLPADAVRLLPLQLSIGWLSQQTLNALIYQAGARVSEDLGERFLAS